jgi:hypothetical protein
MLRRENFRRDGERTLHASHDKCEHAGLGASREPNPLILNFKLTHCRVRADGIESCVYFRLARARPNRPPQSRLISRN